VRGGGGTAPDGEVRGPRARARRRPSRAQGRARTSLGARAGSHRALAGREKRRGRGGRGKRRGAHLGIQNPAITVTKSPWARGGREREVEERGREFLRGKNQMRERERERQAHGGERGARGAPGRATPGWAGSG
jgi:hypothetical protein